MRKPSWKTVFIHVSVLLILLYSVSINYVDDGSSQVRITLIFTQEILILLGIVGLIIAYMRYIRKG